MGSIDSIVRYFPGLSKEQQDRLGALPAIYRSYNQRVNLVSRQDIDHFVVHHLLHSLAPVEFFPLATGSRVVDVGTGGGLPGIPLAIAFPKVHFVLMDSALKKAKAVRSIVEELGVSNVRVVHDRIEKNREVFDYALGRAVMPLPRFIAVTRKRIAAPSGNEMDQGVLYWTGGAVDEELEGVGRSARIFSLKEWSPLSFFRSKKVVFVPIG